MWIQVQARKKTNSEQKLWENEPDPEEENNLDAISSLITRDPCLNLVLRETWICFSTGGGIEYRLEEAKVEKVDILGLPCTTVKGSFLFLLHP